MRIKQNFFRFFVLNTNKWQNQDQDPDPEEDACLKQNVMLLQDIIGKMPIPSKKVKQKVKMYQLHAVNPLEDLEDYPDPDLEEDV